jgi:hypothetical protein
MFEKYDIFLKNHSPVIKYNLFFRRVIYFWRIVALLSNIFYFPGVWFISEELYHCYKVYFIFQAYDLFLKNRSPIIKYILFSRRVIYFWRIVALL